MEASKAFTVFAKTAKALNDPELQDVAAQKLMSACCSNGWKTLRIAQLDQDNIFMFLTGGLYAEAADALKSAVNEAKKRNTAMKKKATVKTSEATAKKQATKKVVKKVAVDGAKKPVKKATVAKSRYGHRVGSSAEFMDEQLFKGCDPDKGADALAQKFGIGVAKAKAKLLVHVRYLKKERNIVFATFKDSPKLKAKTEKYTPSK